LTNIIFRGQVSTESYLGSLNFGEIATYSGFLDTGSAKYPLFAGFSMISLIDYTNVSSVNGHTTSLETTGIDGITNSNFYFHLVKNIPDIYIYHMDSTILKLINIPGTLVRPLIGALVPNSNFILVYFNENNFNTIAYIDYTLAAGSEILFSTVVPYIPWSLGGLNTLNYGLIGNNPPQLIIHEMATDTDVFIDSDTSTFPNQIVVSSTDNYIIYTTEDKYLTVLKADSLIVGNPPPSTPASSTTPANNCDYSYQVSNSGICFDCLNIQDYILAKEHCRGATSDGDNLFLNYEIKYEEFSYFEEIS